MEGQFCWCIPVEKVFFFWFWKGNEEKKRGGKWFTGVCLLKMVFFLEGLFLYFMVSEPTRELGCWNNNPKPACLENQTVPVFFDFMTDRNRNGNSFVIYMPYTHPISLVDPNTNYVHNEDHNHWYSLVWFGYQAILSIYLQKSLRCSDEILIHNQSLFLFVYY